MSMQQSDIHVYNYIGIRIPCRGKIVDKYLNISSMHNYKKQCDTYVLMYTVLVKIHCVKN